MGQSIISNERRCYLCGNTYGLDKHHIFNGGGYRKKAETDGLWIYLCRGCHEEIHRNAVKRLELKKFGQEVYEEKIGTRQEFRKRYGKYYKEEN